MNQYIIIDKRMREIEKSFLKSMGYVLVELQKSNQTYPEISSHVDIFVCSINNTIFTPKSIYDHVLCEIKLLKR